MRASCVPIDPMCSNDVVISKDMTLDGARVRLEPLDLRHADDLLRNCSDAGLWEWTFQPNPFQTVESARAWAEHAIAAPDEVAFAIVDKASGEAIGSTRYLDIAAAHRKLEIGWTFVAKAYWRTHVNTDSKILLLSYAFDEAGISRVAFKADAINARSRAAILRIGATHEGTLRRFRIRPIDGDVRDVGFYSILRTEWPRVREALLRKAKSGIHVAGAVPPLGADIPA